jgi:hypothetical protein
MSSFLTLLLWRTKLLDIYNHVIYLDWDGLNGSHLNFLKRCHGQAKLYSYLPRLAFLIQTPKLVSFPCFCPPPIFYCLVSPSPRLQILEDILVHVFSNLNLWCRNVLLWVVKISSTIQEMCRCPIFQHVCHVHDVIYLWIFPYFKESWNLRYGSPLNKHKMEIPAVVRKQ